MLRFRAICAVHPVDAGAGECGGLVGGRDALAGAGVDGNEGSVLAPQDIDGLAGAASGQAQLFDRLAGVEARGRERLGRGEKGVRTLGGIRILEGFWILQGTGTCGK